jgi:carotenoid 1,2-hydratase
MSDDGAHALTIIAFVGSVFSPYYAWARQRGAADPLQHCAINVALYGRHYKRWSLTERPAHAIRRSPATLAIGPSALHWDGDALTIDIDETTFPFPSRIRGTVRVCPSALPNYRVWLDGERQHSWSPLAPSARVEVSLAHPRLQWAGGGYLDHNAGNDPLERAFSRWDWSRASVGNDTVVLYDVARRDGGTLSFATRFDASGSGRPVDVPESIALPATRWRVARSTRADAGRSVTVVKTLEDTPFYARSMLRTHLDGEPATAVHESLSLDRFRAPWVRCLLPFRTPRVRS